jgi:hypothetical protein
MSRLSFAPCVLTSPRVDRRLATRRVSRVSPGIPKPSGYDSETRPTAESQALRNLRIYEKPEHSRTPGSCRGTIATRHAEEVASSSSVRPRGAASCAKPPSGISRDDIRERFVGRDGYGAHPSALSHGCGTHRLVPQWSCPKVRQGRVRKSGARAPRPKSCPGSSESFCLRAQSAACAEWAIQARRSCTVRKQARGVGTGRRTIATTSNSPALWRRPAAYRRCMTRPNRTSAGFKELEENGVRLGADLKCFLGLIATGEDHP